MTKTKKNVKTSRHTENAPKKGNMEKQRRFKKTKVRAPKTSKKGTGDAEKPGKKVNEQFETTKRQKIPNRQGETSLEKGITPGEGMIGGPGGNGGNHGVTYTDS